MDVASPRLHRRLLRWYRDDLINRLIRNVGYLLSGHLVAAGLGLIALALTARALGPAQLGLLALIEAYARLIDRLIRVEPWQALIKYGADALESDRPEDFRSLLKFGVLIDAGGAACGALVAVSFVALAGPWLDWSEQTVQMAMVYGASLLFQLSATPIAVLRLFDRFSVFAWLEVATAAARVALFGVAFLAGAGLWTFLLLVIALSVSYTLGLVLIAWRELRRRGHAGFLKARVAGVGTRFPKIWNFIWSLQASFLIRRSTGDLDTLLIGTLLDPGAVGLYHVAKRLGDATLKVGIPIQQVLFPDVARLWARREIQRLRRTVVQIDLIAGGLAAGMLAGVALNVDLVLGLTVGAEYADAGILVILQLIGTTTALFGTALRPAMLSMGLQMQLLKIVIVATLGFYATLLTLLPVIGVVGASIAHIVLNTLWLGAAGLIFVQRIREEIRACDAVPVAASG
jgi:O-antigen/teichoic acid export membrane protein